MRTESPNSIEKFRHSRRPLCYILLGAVIGIVLALGLGLGLGLGLRKSRSGSPGNSGSSGPPPETTPANASITSTAPWGEAVNNYGLDMTWDINAAPTTRIFNFTVSEIQAAPDGVTRQILAINGQFPGPLIRVNRGDRVLVNVTNALSNATTMHWHGLYQNGTNWMDGTTGITQCGIPPGQSFLYNFTVENQFGTYWYHSHYGTQYVDGVVGPFIVHAPDEASIREQYDVDQVILIQDWYHDLSTALLPAYLASGNENTEPVPDNGLIQGRNYFDCSNAGDGYTCGDSSRAAIVVEQGKRYRIRLVNTGAFGAFQFSVDNHTLTVIEADATLLEPVEVHRIDIAVAQRYSFILTANQTATNYWIRSQMNTFCFSNNNPILNPDVMGLLTYTNTTGVPTASTDWADALELQCVDLNVSSLVPSVPSPAPQPDVTYLIDVSFQIGAYALDKAYINSTTWVPEQIPTLNQAIAGLQADNSSFSATGLSNAYGSSQFVLNIPDDQVVDLIINNYDEGAHPFHLHGHTFWILAQGATGYYEASKLSNIDVSNPLYRDTLTVDAYGWALIRFRADNPGLWALHCHIAWHMEAGLLMQFQAGDSTMKNWILPSDVAALCDAS